MRPRNMEVHMSMHAMPDYEPSQKNDCRGVSRRWQLGVLMLCVLLLVPVFVLLTLFVVKGDRLRAAVQEFSHRPASACRFESSWPQRGSAP